MEDDLTRSSTGAAAQEFERSNCGFGFIVDVAGKASHRIIKDSLKLLTNLEHRGAVGAEADTGDGAGILVQVPDEFLRAVWTPKVGSLPPAGRYAVGVVFLPNDPDGRAACEAIIEELVRQEGQSVLGWRDVPSDSSHLGATARAFQPTIRQIFVERSADITDGDVFERKLYVIRRLIEKRVQRSFITGRSQFYICSFSARTVVYKGMLSAPQLQQFFTDLSDPRFASAISMVHSRFSTNTFPSWARAHPYRYISHNGEINTLRGNVNWAHARQSRMRSSLFGDELRKALTVIDTEGSDSAMFDNFLELLVLAGREIPHAMMMMMPEPWSRHEQMPKARRAFYEFHGCLMEPWDGPASIAFTDGIRVGAVLDRNGLRPSRYYLTDDGLVVMASEVGVLDLPPERIVEKGRLRPGQLFLVDTSLGRVVGDDELKDRLAGERPYQKWLDENLVRLRALPDIPQTLASPEAIAERQKLFGYTQEELTGILVPMASNGEEPLGSMGDDTPLAVLSRRPQPLFNYFRQLFAQVTNPPIDAIREELIMDYEMSVGPEKNILEPGPESARQLALPMPILKNGELEKIRRLDGKAEFSNLKAVTLPILFPVKSGGAGLRRSIEELCYQVSDCIAEGYNIIILSDRGHDANTAPIPSLLAVSAVQQHLIKEGSRTDCGIILESGEPREVHHFAMLIGYGASGINPYLAFETIADQARRGFITHPLAMAETKYAQAIVKGVVKIISKMGISTIQSYHGAQVFEALGLNQDFVDEYFNGTASRIGGVGIEIVAREVLSRHTAATRSAPLDFGGRFRYRNDGERHVVSPQVIERLQTAVRREDYAAFKEYSALVDNSSRDFLTLRGLLEFAPSPRSIPIDAVEPVEEIIKRFKTGAMSYGSISQEAHEALAVAMNRLGARSNTGEGGEDPSRFAPLPNGDSKRSAIKQVASGRFGVTLEYLTQAQEIQIKMAQGAKPGEGGQLPGSKVYPWIAKTRHATAGVGLISPPPHHDIYSIEDLAQLIYDLRQANDAARISVKLVAEAGVGTVAAGVAKARADTILISGHDGGTGASPLTGIAHAGIPWEIGIADAHQVLLSNNLRSRVALEVDGQLKTGRDIVIAALLGADEFGFATAPLLALGCLMMRACHLNTCPVGIATQEPQLRSRFRGDPAHVVNLMRFLAEEVRENLAMLGFATLGEAVGRTDRLRPLRAVDHPKAKFVDVSRLLYVPEIPEDWGRKFIPRPPRVDNDSLDARQLLPLAREAILHGRKVESDFAISNVNRAVGTRSGSALVRRHGGAGLPQDTITFHFRGSAGQSFGAFLPRGMTLTLEGDANDYVGKGLSGGMLVITPPKTARFLPENNTILGNVALYGATSGELFARGLAGERFAVRNSGAIAVVEGVGDHACEYMTGGRVIVLGEIGRNFAAGMSGGIAYIFNPEGWAEARCNQAMVALRKLEAPEEVALVQRYIERHVELTGSTYAKEILENFTEKTDQFLKVIPFEYERAIAAKAKEAASAPVPVAAGG